MLQSKLFDLSVTNADEYAELYDAKVQRLLDIHAPMLYVDVVAASMATIICRMKRVRQSKYVEDANGAIDAQAYSRTRRLPISLFCCT